MHKPRQRATQLIYSTAPSPALRKPSRHVTQLQYITRSSPVAPKAARQATQLEYSTVHCLLLQSPIDRPPSCSIVHNTITRYAKARLPGHPAAVQHTNTSAKAGLATQLQYSTQPVMPKPDRHATQLQYSTARTQPGTAEERRQHACCLSEDTTWAYRGSEGKCQGHLNSRLLCREQEGRPVQRRRQCSVQWLCSMREPRPAHPSP